MLRKTLITFLALILCASITHAETVAHYYGGPVGLIPQGTEGKKPGDIISVSTDYAIATSCDFNKQIVVTKNSTLCVYIKQ